MFVMRALSAFYVSYNFEQDSTTSSTQTAMELCILYEVGGVAGYHVEWSDNYVEWHDNYEDYRADTNNYQGYGTLSHNYRYYIELQIIGENYRELCKRGLVYRTMTTRETTELNIVMCFFPDVTSVL